MKKELLRFTLSAIIVYLTSSTLNPAVAVTQPSGGHETHFCGVSDYHPLWRQYAKQRDNRHYARTFANLNVGAPRTVRLIYFLPNDRPYRADVVQEMKDTIRIVQNFFAEQMEAHGYGKLTFRFETDAQGEPKVHRVDGQHSDDLYLENAHGAVIDEIDLAFNFEANVYLIVMDNSIHASGGLGRSIGKRGGWALVSDEFDFKITAHELGHTFGLGHDFKDNAYIMSYGSGPDRLSACHAEYLSVDPYFNLNTPIEDRDPPTIELISPDTYPAGAQSVPIRFKLHDSEGLYQLLLLVPTIEPHRGTGGLEVKRCRGLAGDRDSIVEFDYDGVIPSDGFTTLSYPAIHPIHVEVVDTEGNVGYASFDLVKNSHITPLKGDTDEIYIPDPHLRAAIAEAVGLSPNSPIFRGHLESLIRLEARNANISDLTGLEGAINLRILDLGAEYVEVENRLINSNSVSDLSPLRGLTKLRSLSLEDNNISDISAVARLTYLTHLNFEKNSVSDISAVSELTNLTRLFFSDNSVSDISAVSGLTNLTALFLVDNSVSDISAVSVLTNLVLLGLEVNNISDISAVSGLTNLTWLHLGNNSVSDLSPLLENTGLGSGSSLYLNGNPLNYTSINTHILALQNRGVTVEFDNQFVEMGPNKITGPWLWMIAPTAPGQGGKQSNNVDSLAAASGGDVTEAKVAANGAKEGDVVGNYVWTLGKIARTGGNNINDVINRIGMAQGDVNDHSSYAHITLESATAQPNVTMRVGSDDSIKVWLNREVVHNYPINRGASDFQDSFKVNLKKGDNFLLVKVSEGAGDWSMFVGIEADVNALYKRPPDVVIYADANGDALVNVLDLLMIASSLGQSGQNDADVNGDGIVNMLDLVLAAGMFEEAAAAPAAQQQMRETLTVVEVQGWLTEARSLEVRDPIMKRGFLVLEQLLVSLTPTETKLLANYPNPFNPETSIPYRLAEDAFVKLTIYDLSGQIVRTLDVGHQIASAYESRSKAIYWDGRNQFGETVASGVYFYQLQVSSSRSIGAGDYSVTRKMLIVK